MNAEQLVVFTSRDTIAPRSALNFAHSPPPSTASTLLKNISITTMASSSHLPSPPDSPTADRSSAVHASRSSSLTATASGHGHLRTPSITSIGGTVFTHPFAASAKATQPPPDYWQRHGLVRPRTPERVTANQQVQLCTPPSETTSGARRVSFQPEASLPDPRSREEKLWEDAIDTLINEATGEIDLQNKGITSIPPSIADAANLVVLKKARTPSSRNPFVRQISRTTSAPATLALDFRAPLGRTRTMAPSSTVNVSNDSPLEERKFAELQLLLASNSITKLPTEMFRLEGLTVLSLRGNKLTHIPPAIATLVNLEELNLSNNLITYLPSEIILLPLQKLLINANPLLSELPLPSYDGRMLGGLIVLREGVRSLQDIVLSQLLGPSLLSTAPQGSTSSRLTVLEQTYELPLNPDSCSTTALAKIEATLPKASRSLYASLLDPDDARFNSRFNKCPSPHHTDSTTAIFIDHAEERFEWVKTIAQEVISDLPGSLVPIRWRGCTMGCLAFLEEVHVERNTVTLGTLGEAEWDDEFELDA